jgi:hypothetical protein
MPRKPKTQFNIRISEALMKKLTTAAARRDVTVTAEAVTRLEQSFVESGVEALVSATAKMMAHHVTEDLMQKMEGLVFKIVMTEINKQKEQSNG